MASIESKIFNMILKFTTLKKTLDKAFETGEFGKGSINEPPKKLFSDVNIEKIQVGGKNVFTLKPKNESSGKTILYLHGGAYIQGFSMIHWRFIKQLIQATKCTIIAPDYPLAPNFTCIDSFKMVKPVYKELVSRAGGENVILMGDFSGGSFALALAETMKEEVSDYAKQIILLSPWLDITMENKDINEIDLKDSILGINGLKMAGKSYAGTTDPSNYLLSPINGDVKGLGKISVFIGTRDILEADTRKFKRITEEAGVDINYFEYQDMPHVWMFFNLPESKKAMGQIVIIS
jgi:acetyl esterase/lipase